MIGYVCRLLGVGGGEYVRTALLPPLLLGMFLGCGWLVSVNYAPIDSWMMFLLTGSAGMAIYLPLATLVELGPRTVWERIRGRLPLPLQSPIP